MALVVEVTLAVLTVISSVLVRVGEFNGLAVMEKVIVLLVPSAMLNTLPLKYSFVEKTNSSMSAESKEQYDTIKVKVMINNNHFNAIYQSTLRPT